MARRACGEVSGADIGSSNSTFHLEKQAPKQAGRKIRDQWHVDWFRRRPPRDRRERISGS